MRTVRLSNVKICVTRDTLWLTTAATSNAIVYAEAETQWASALQLRWKLIEIMIGG